MRRASSGRGRARDALVQRLITIGLAAATIFTRTASFVLFSEKRPVPRVVEYLGGVLPLAIFALLVVYCLRNVDFLAGAHGIPEVVSVLVTAPLHLWKRNMLVSIACGTACYMLLTALVF